MRNLAVLCMAVAGLLVSACGGELVEGEAAHAAPLSSGADRDTCICDDRYAPVCGEDGVTYDNKCWAGCAGVDVAYEGRCNCICPQVHAPVCGVDGNTYGNKCMAACAGVDVDYEGECRSSCICPEVYAPVCGVDGVTYDNACKAGCAGVEIRHEGPCRNEVRPN